MNVQICPEGRRSDYDKPFSASICTDKNDVLSANFKALNENKHKMVHI